MDSMNNWLGFSLSHQEIPSSQQHQHQHQNPISRGGFHSEEISGADMSAECFDLTSDSALPSLNLPPPFGILEAFNRTNHPSQDWNVKDAQMDTSRNYKSSSSEMASVLMGTSCSNPNLQNHQAKLENFLGGLGGNSCISGQQYSNLQGCNSNNNDNNSISIGYPNSSVQREGGGGGVMGNNDNTNIGLSMIKNWLRTNGQEENKNVNNVDGDDVVGANVSVNANNAQNLSLSMSTGGSQSTGGGLPLMTAGSSEGGGGGGGDGGESSTTESKQSNGMGLDSQSGAIETVPRKSIDTFGQRTSIYRGVTRHRWTGRYEAHLWDNSCRREGQTRKGRQVYLGGYDKEEKAARSYDLAALKYWGTTTTTNFPISNYEKELEDMKHMTRQEYVASLRRKSSGFSRGASIYRGVTRHHQHGRWQARIGRVAGNKDLYLGTFSTQEEAAEAYDIAAIKFRGLNAVTNFEINRYDVKSILESSTLPIGGAAKRLKEAEHAEMALEAHRATVDSMNSHLTEVLNSRGMPPHVWPSIAFPQAQPLTMQYPYGQQKLWCKQEYDSEINHHHTLQDIHPIQYGNTHNFFQPSHVLHNLMSLDSASMEHSSGSNSIIYGSGGDHGSASAYYGSNNSFALPMGTVIAQEGAQNQVQGFGENEVRQIGYENMIGSEDPYQTRNFYYNPQQTSTGIAKPSLYDQGSSCDDWTPTVVPTLAARANSMAACHGASTFTVWNDT